MLKKKTEQNRIVVYENWIKPPKIVTYSNSRLLYRTGNALVCQFFFPEKYAGNDFYLAGKKVLSAGQMYTGKRFFYNDRFYSLLEFYSGEFELSAYYLDIVLPARFSKNNIYIMDLKLDFFILPDLKNYILLDEDELEEAVDKKYFTNEEIAVCLHTRDFIIEKLEAGRFQEIFFDYRKSQPADWLSYNKWFK